MCALYINFSASYCTSTTNSGEFSVVRWSQTTTVVGLYTQIIEQVGMSNVGFLAVCYRGLALAPAVPQGKQTHGLTVKSVSFRSSHYTGTLTLLPE